MSSEWLRSKKESITNDDNCFQNALNVSLDYKRIKKDPQKISKRKPYINHYNWKILVSIMICMFNGIHFCLLMYLKTL